MAKPAKATRNRPSSTASACIAGKRQPEPALARAPSSVRAACSDRRPSLPWTSPNQPGRRYHGGARPRQQPVRPQKPPVQAAPRIRTGNKKGGPKAALFAKSLVSRPDQFAALLAGLSIAALSPVRRRASAVDLDAVQQVVGHLQRLVVLGVRRHVGLRAGLLVAVGLQMAAQRGFALGVGPRLQLVRHVLQHLDIGNDALGLDRLARRREVARGGQTQRAVAASRAE